MKQYIYIYIIAVAVLCSCTKTVYIPTETIRTEYRTDTLRQTQVLRDSVYHRDSIYVDGQTVYKELWRYQYITRRDTLYKVKVDTVYHTREVTKMVEVPRKESKWSKFLRWCGLVAIFGAIGFGAWKIRKILHNI